MPIYRVPKPIQDIAANAIAQNLELPVSKRAAYKDTDEGKRVAGTGMDTARKLASGTVDKEQLQLMAAWFARHGASEAEKKNRKDIGSKASIAWRLWGGSGAISWVNSTLKQIAREEEEEKKGR